jgi:hypothetical protein
MTLRAVKDELQVVGCAMAQAVSRRSVTSEARVYFQDILCKTCDGQNATGTRFFLNTSVSFLSAPFHQCSTLSHSLHTLRCLISDTASVIKQRA